MLQNIVQLMLQSYYKKFVSDDHNSFTIKCVHLKIVSVQLKNLKKYFDAFLKYHVLWINLF